MLGLQRGNTVLALMFWSAAWASTPVLLDGVEAARGEEAARRAGVEDPRFVDVESLRQGAPYTVEGDEVLTCNGTAPRLDQAIADVSGELNYMNDAGALERGQAALQGLLCGDVEPKALASLAFLTGLAAQYAGNDSTAEKYWVFATSLDPTLTWDENYGDEGRVAFESLDRTPSILSTPHVDGLTMVDGGAPDRAVSVGWHRVDLGGQSFLVQSSAKSTLVVPELADPWQDSVLPGLESERWLVVDDRRIQWSDGVAIQRRSRAPILVTGAGLVAMGAGVAVAAYVDGVTASDPDNPDRSQGRWRRDRALYYGGLGLSAVGGGLVLGGAIAPRLSVKGRF